MTGASLRVFADAGLDPRVRGYTVKMPADVVTSDGGSGTMRVIGMGASRQVAWEWRKEPRMPDYGQGLDRLVPTLVTGAGGFIGGHLVGWLKANGFSAIRGVD